MGKWVRSSFRNIVTVMNQYLSTFEVNQEARLSYFWLIFTEPKLHFIWFAFMGCTEISRLAFQFLNGINKLLCELAITKIHFKSWPTDS